HRLISAVPPAQRHSQVTLAEIRRSSGTRSRDHFRLVFDAENRSRKRQYPRAAGPGHRGFGGVRFRTGSVADTLRFCACRLSRNRLDRDGVYFPTSRQVSRWPGIGHRTRLKSLPDCSSSAPPQIGQVSPSTNAEARVSTFSANWLMLSFIPEAD